MQKLMSTAEAARALDLTPAMVRVLARSGQLATAVETEGGVRLFDRQDVERLRNERAEPVPSDDVVTPSST
jgi:DNA-binding transcriptional MerR regulator